jgi:hypothetical protein
VKYRKSVLPPGTHPAIPRSMPAEYLINEADRRMYADKRLMKKT